MFTLRVVTPKGDGLTLEVDRVSLPSIDGIITVLEKHMDLMVPVEFGIMKIKLNNEITKYVISDGLFTFKDNAGVLLVNSVENAKNIDFNRAKDSKRRAETRLEEKKSIDNLERAEYSLKRSLIRLSLEED